jgi:SAM-dependent methyltransferase
MINPFVASYDLLYADKDYRQDIQAFTSLTPNLDYKTSSLLEIGAGTGNQSCLLAPLFKAVTCCETNADFGMLLKKKLESQALRNVDVLETPIELVPAKPYDAAVAFFHVINYMDEIQLTAFLSGLAKNLKPGAPFVADLWHEEAVCLSPPRAETRQKCIDGRDITVEINPTFNKETKRVSLDYHVEITDSKDTLKFHERLNLHLWLKSELETRFHEAGFMELQFWDYRTFPQPLAPESWRMWMRCFRSSGSEA